MGTDLSDRDHPEVVVRGGEDHDALKRAFNQAVQQFTSGGTQVSDERFYRPSLRGDGRHSTKFTWYRVETVLEKLEKGMSKRSAAEAAGVEWETLRSWQAEGREMLERVERGEEIDEEGWLRAAFVVALNRAYAEGEERHFDVVDEAAVEGGSWKASMELLKATRKRRYAKHRSVERTTVHEGEVEIKLDTPSPPEAPAETDEVERLAERMAEDNMLADDDRKLLEARGVEVDIDDG